MAQEGGYLAVVRTLIAHGAPINEMDACGLTPLHKACLRGSVEAVELLLRHGHPVDQRGHHELTPLHLACRGGHLYIVAVLIEKNHPVNVKDSSGSTPLHVACQKENVGIATKLLVRGADANVKDDHQWTPFHIACNRGNLDMVKLLLKYGVQASGQSLHFACGSLELVEFLLQKGLSVKDEDELGLTPLHAACAQGSVEVVKTLLEHGAPVNAVAVGMNSEVPLHVACRRGNFKIVEVLLEKGAYVDAKDVKGNTPWDKGVGCLMRADVMGVLLDYKAASNVVCNCGRFRQCTNITCLYNHYYLLQRKQLNDYADHILSAYERHFIKTRAAGVHFEESANKPHCFLSTKRGLLCNVNKRDGDRLKCLAELGIMKKEKVNNTNVSYFNILRQDISALRNHNSMKILLPDQLRKMFPIYGNMIYCSYRNLPKRSFLVDQSRGFLDLTDLPRLPPECVLEVLVYLSDEDLRHLIEACKPQGGSNNYPKKKLAKKSRCVIC